MLYLGQFALKYFDCLLCERSEDRESAGQPFLAKPAVTDRGDERIACDSVSNGAAGAAAQMGVCH